MGKKGSSSKVEEEEREGNNLLGKPKFKKIEGKDRYRCVETGHEVPNNEEAKAAYSLTKHCRIGLIDSSLSKNKPPLNIFRQHPTCRLKLICQLTGDTINKSEEHIWKHINGKRFLNMLEKKEAEKETGSETVEGDKPKEDHLKEKRKKKKEKKKNKKGEGEEKKKEEDSDIGKHNSETINSSDKECDSENGDFWEPPVGERWDMDDGGERWSSCSDSDCDAEFEHDDDVANEADDVVDDESKSKEEAKELSRRTKRMAIEMEPSNLALRKKKKKKNEAPE